MRITPAPAGRRNTDGVKAFGSKDHPRACGEKLSVLHIPAFQLGSPPRLRGEDPPVEAVDDGVGITPAPAGRRAHQSLLTMMT